MSSSTLQPLAIEPWLGGSHQRFLETWARHSSHRIQVMGLPGRHWKWRMEGAAFTLAHRCREAAVPAPDLIFASDYLDLARFRGFLPPEWTGIPVVYYLHENQLTYPVRDLAAQDNHYGFSNILSCLAADRILFNSQYHKDAFAAAATALLEALPRPSPRAELRAALAGAQIAAPGIETEGTLLGPGAPQGAPLRVLFNHRWEHDKQPREFLEAVLRVKQEHEVEVVMLGQTSSAMRQSRGGATSMFSSLLCAHQALGTAAKSSLTLPTE